MTDEEAVDRFASLMKEELRRNAEKGDWRGIGKDNSWMEILDHMAKLTVMVYREQKKTTYKPNGYTGKTVKRLAADVGVCLMFLLYERNEL